MSMRELPYPVTLSDPHDGAVPHKYVCFERRQHCTCCGRTHVWSELYALTHLRPTWHMGKLISNLRALVWPKYRLPIEQRAALKTERIPFCHACYEPSLANSYEYLDPPPDTQELKRHIASTLSTPSAPKSAPKRAQDAKRKAATADEIMELIS